MTEMRPDFGRRRGPEKPSAAEILAAFPHGVFAAAPRTFDEQRRMGGWGSSRDQLTGVALQTGSVEVETERDPHRDRSGSLLHSLIHPRIFGQLTFPLDLRIDREEIVIEIDGQRRSFEAYVLDDDVAAHVAVGDVHVAVRCRREDLDSIRLETLGRDELNEVVQYEPRPDE